MQISCVLDSGEGLPCSFFLGGFMDLIELGFIAPRGGEFDPKRLNAGRKDLEYYLRTVVMMAKE